MLFIISCSYRFRNFQSENSIALELVGASENEDEVPLNAKSIFNFAQNQFEWQRKKNFLGNSL